MTRQETPVRYRITGMDCASCAMKIETAVRRLPGVEDVGVSATAQTMRVNGPADPTAVEATVRGLGYGIAAENRGAGTDDPQNNGHEAHDHDHGAEGHVHSHADLGDGPWWRSGKARLTMICALALVAAYVAGLVLPGLGHWPFVAALAVGLVPVARRALSAARAGTPFSIETLMTIAAVGAVIIGATEEAAMVVLLFLVGELLEGVAAQRARASISGLTELIPATALIGAAGALREVPAETLKPGDVITVRPGDRLAADGVIVEGSSTLDEAPVTGESVAVAKAPGASVFAGTINTEAVLRVEVTATAENNTIARVVRLVEEAQESKAPTERFIDRFARYYTPAVLALGALVAVGPPLLTGADWGTWVYKGLAVLLIGCPCALVISTPAAIAAGLSAGARRGLLIKGGAVLEKLREVDMVAFDKTGTLTAGRPVVTDIVPVARTGAEVLALAAAVESGSSHPLARAILSRAEADGIAVPAASDAAAIAGKGVRAVVAGEEVTLASPTQAEAVAGPDATREGQIAALTGAGKTVSVLIVADQVAGLIAFRDELRADAIPALARLKADGVGAVMLTGDNPRTAKAIAAELGIEVHAGMLPGDKQDVVRALQASGKVVAKVGDGINDAPALAAADVGIAMGGGTDVALETADAAALHARMADIPAMISLSRTTMANITQNIAIALGLKGVFLVTTLLGITGLWPAILADTGATVLVTANALRLLGWKPQA